MQNKIDFKICHGVEIENWIDVIAKKRIEEFAKFGLAPTDIIIEQTWPTLMHDHSVVNSVNNLRIWVLSQF